MNENAVRYVQVGSEMSESVEGRFVLPPVVGVMPVADQFPEVIDIGASLNSRARIGKVVGQRLQGDG